MRLVEHADVVVVNYRVGVVERLGIDYSAASTRNRGIVYCAISGFGQDGPYRDRSALDLILQAESGIISVTGEPGSTGTRSGVSIADLTAGMYAACAILLGEHTHQVLSEMLGLSAAEIENYAAAGVFG